MQTSTANLHRSPSSKVHAASCLRPAQQAALQRPTCSTMQNRTRTVHQQWTLPRVRAPVERTCHWYDPSASPVYDFLDRQEMKLCSGAGEVAPVELDSWHWYPAAFAAMRRVQSQAGGPRSYVQPFWLMPLHTRYVSNQRRRRRCKVGVGGATICAQDGARLAMLQRRMSLTGSRWCHWVLTSRSRRAPCTPPA
jgi:hypothetical protein